MALSDSLIDACVFSFIYLFIYLLIHFFFMVLEIKLRPSHMLPKYSTTELHPQLLISRSLYLPLNILCAGHLPCLGRASGGLLQAPGKALIPWGSSASILCWIQPRFSQAPLPPALRELIFCSPGRSDIMQCWLLYSFGPCCSLAPGLYCRAKTASSSPVFPSLHHYCQSEMPVSPRVCDF